MSSLAKPTAYILKLDKASNLRDQWDMGFMLDFLAGQLWQTPNWVGFEIAEVNRLPAEDARALVLIAARHHAGLEGEVNAQLSGIDNVVLFLMGDEEASFDVSQIDHPSIHIWVQNPHMGTHDRYNKLGTGYPQHIHKYIPKVLRKDCDLFHAGQNTHPRRQELAEALENLLYNSDLKFIAKHTAGFTQGMPPAQYYDFMTSAIAAPAPSGAVIPDSFRLFEALECMAFAIADEQRPNGDIWHYWDWLFADITPFYKVTNFFALQSLVEDIKDGYPANAHKQTAWWIKYKRDFVYKVMEQYGL